MYIFDDNWVLNMNICLEMSIFLSIVSLFTVVEIEYVVCYSNISLM